MEKTYLGAPKIILFYFRLLKFSPKKLFGAAQKCFFLSWVLGMEKWAPPECFLKGQDKPEDAKNTNKYPSPGVWEGVGGGVLALIS